MQINFLRQSHSVDGVTEFTACVLMQWLKYVLDYVFLYSMHACMNVWLGKTGTYPKDPNLDSQLSLWSLSFIFVLKNQAICVKCISKVKKNPHFKLPHILTENYCGGLLEKQIYVKML